MNILLYIDPLFLSISSSHTLLLLKLYFKKININYNIDICIPNNYDIPNRPSEHCYLNENYDKKYGYGINWFHYEPNNPSSFSLDLNKYDIVMLLHVFEKTWVWQDCRKNILKYAEKYKKPVIAIKSDMTLEYRYLNNNVLYGVNSNNLLDRLPNRWILPNTVKKFLIPCIGNLLYPKPNALSKNDFYKKYNLDKNKKIIIFTLGNLRKLKIEFKNINSNMIYYFLNNINRIQKIFNNNNYQLIFKIHRIQDFNKDPIKDIKKFNIDNIKYIDNEDSHEAIKYSSRAISFCTCMVYELYLYNLPVMELGNGIYYPSWISNLTRSSEYTCCPLVKYNMGKDLVFGKIFNYKLNKDNIKKEIYDFLNTEYDINKFKYKNNHPIYGNSYGKTIEDVGDILIDQCKQILKKNKK
jgi:hypothetical protein